MKSAVAVELALTKAQRLGGGHACTEMQATVDDNAYPTGVTVEAHNTHICLFA